MEKTGSFEYTNKVMKEYESKILQEIERLGGNASLVQIIEHLSKTDK